MDKINIAEKTSDRVPIRDHSSVLAINEMGNFREANRGTRDVGLHRSQDWQLPAHWVLAYPGFHCVG